MRRKRGGNGRVGPIIRPSPVAAICKTKLRSSRNVWKLQGFRSNLQHQKVFRRQALRIQHLPILL